MVAQWVAHHSSTLRMILVTAGDRRLLHHHHSPVFSFCSYLLNSNLFPPLLSDIFFYHFRPLSYVLLFLFWLSQLMCSVPLFFKRPHTLPLLCRSH